MGIFNDVVALAKAWWTPSDIKEILEKDKEQTKEKEESKEDTKVFEKKNLPEDEEKEDEEKEDDGKDYKALYESSQKALNEIQVKNTKEDMKPEVTNIEDLIKDIKSHIS